jgi:hypothetical protein
MHIEDLEQKPLIQNYLSSKWPGPLYQLHVVTVTVLDFLLTRVSTLKYIIIQ